MNCSVHVPVRMLGGVGHIGGAGSRMRSVRVRACEWDEMSE
jgi:hypothetical protein